MSDYGRDHYTPPSNHGALPGHQDYPMTHLEGYPSRPFHGSGTPDSKTQINDNEPEWHANRQSMSDMQLTHHYDSEEEDTGPLPRIRQKRSCMDKLCCGCCTCCPKWARWCSCILLLILIGLGIAVGVLAALFKVPQVEFNGLKDTPQSSVQGSQLNFTFALNIGVNNPNIESVTFESIVAKASYPNYPTLNLGGGELDNVHINNNGITNITFPFALSLDTVSPDYAGILSDLLSKCGFGGAAKQDITVDYAVTLTVRIIGIAIRPTINNKANFPCPLQSSDLSQLGGGGLSSLIPASVGTP